MLQRTHVWDIILYKMSLENFKLQNKYAKFKFFQVKIENYMAISFNIQDILCSVQNIGINEFII